MSVPEERPDGDSEPSCVDKGEDQPIDPMSTRRRRLSTALLILGLLLVALAIVLAL